MTCPGGFSCASLEGFVNAMWPFMIMAGIGASVILVRMFMSESQEKTLKGFVKWLKK